MPDTLDDMMLADSEAAASKPDKLDFLKKHVIAKRELDLQIESSEEALKRLKEERRRYEFETLPELFLQANVPAITIGADGNMPAATYECKPHYYANISAEWEPERREQGFACLRAKKLDDLIKNKLTCQFGRGQGAAAKKAMAALRKLKVPFENSQAVAWNALTAAVKEIYEGGKELSDTEKRLLGATAGYVVKLKVERKQREKQGGKA